MTSRKSRNKEQNQLISVLGEGRTDDAGRNGAAAVSQFVQEATRRQVGETEDKSADIVGDAETPVLLSSIYYQFLSLQQMYAMV